MKLLTPDQYADTYARLARSEANRDTVLGRLTVDHLTRTLLPYAVLAPAELERVTALEQWADTPEQQATRLSVVNTDADAIHITTLRKKTTK